MKTRTQGDEVLRRVEMWCAREWITARESSMAALAAGDGKTYRAHQQDEGEWFAALLVVNRLNLGIEPLEGKTFLPVP